MKDYILTCSCHNMNKRATEAMALLLPERKIPEIVKGRDRIYKLSQALNNEHIKAISRLSGKFAYYIRLENDVIAEEYDLVKGTRIS